MEEEAVVPIARGRGRGRGRRVEDSEQSSLMASSFGVDSGDFVDSLSQFQHADAGQQRRRHAVEIVNPETGVEVDLYSGSGDAQDVITLDADGYPTSNIAAGYTPSSQIQDYSRGEMEQNMRAGLSATAAPPSLGRGRARGRTRAAFDSVMEPTPGAVKNLEMQTEKLSIGDRSRNRSQRNIEDETMITRPLELSSKKGKSGTPITVTCNYFKLLSFTTFELYQHRVDFLPQVDSTKERQQLIRQHKSILGGFLFDGTVMFTAQPFQQEPMQIVTKNHNGEKVVIKIRLVECLKPGHVQYLQLFNILLRRCMQALDLQLVGRHYFDPQSSVSVHQYRLELWPGYITSIRQHEDDILMCTEISHKVMRRENVLDILLECARNNPSEYQVEFKKRIIGTIVLTDYNNKTYRVDDIDFTNTPEFEFELDNTKISFITYYKKKYNLAIKTKNQPMLVSRPKQRSLRRGETQLLYLVPELCRTTGITDEMRRDFNLMRALADHTRVGPRERQERLGAFQKRLLSSKQVQEEFAQWNLKLSPDLVSIPARVLKPENIFFGGSSTANVGPQADWTRLLKTGKMLSAPKLQCWGVVAEARARNDVLEFIELLKKVARGINFEISTPKITAVKQDRTLDFMRGLDELRNSGDQQLVMLVLPTRSVDRYSAVKKRSCVDTGLPTQVVLNKSLTSKNKSSIASKIAIQLCCKIGGAPWSLDIPIKGLMVVGFDVYHDTGARGASIGALVASLDKAMTRYFSAVTCQKSGGELSHEMAINMIKAVHKFRTVNNELPEKIVIYRDGVGEGQVQYVKDTELKHIRDALNNLYKGRRVQLGFIIVTKRINTRLFHGNSNPEPGTVVDDVITLPQRYDFFLVSQCVRQGTVSPTSYNVIWDELNLEPDKIQRLTYKLTHMYFNWSGTVRVPAPVQYAHKLAFLVGQALHCTPTSSLEDLLYFL